MTRLGNFRFAARRDASEPAIIEALEKAGWQVWRKLPVDLLCYKAATDTFRTLECKSLGEPLVPREGPQKAFVEATGCKIVDSPEKALELLK